MGQQKTSFRDEPEARTWTCGRDARRAGVAFRGNDPLAYNPYTYHYGAKAAWHGACSSGNANRTEEVSWYQTLKTRDAPASGQGSRILEAS